MSIAELKETAERLNAKERAWLKAYLAAKARACDPAWKAEMARRLQRLRAGRGVVDTDYRRLARENSKRASAAAQ